MNRDVAKAKLLEWTGKIKETWAKLTLNSTAVKGRQEEVLGTLRRIHRHLEQIEREYDKFESLVGESLLLEHPRR